MSPIKIQKNLHRMPFEIMNTLNCRKQRTYQQVYTHSDGLQNILLGWLV